MRDPKGLRDDCTLQGPCVLPEISGQLITAVGVQTTSRHSGYGGVINLCRLIVLFRLPARPTCFCLCFELERSRYQSLCGKACQTSQDFCPKTWGWYYRVIRVIWENIFWLRWAVRELHIIHVLYAHVQMSNRNIMWLLMRNCLFCCFTGRGTVNRYYLHQ